VKKVIERDDEGWLVQNWQYQRDVIIEQHLINEHVQSNGCQHFY